MDVLGATLHIWVADLAIHQSCSGQLVLPCPYFCKEHWVTFQLSSCGGRELTSNKCKALSGEQRCVRER